MREQGAELSDHFTSTLNPIQYTISVPVLDLTPHIVLTPA